MTKEDPIKNLRARISRAPKKPGIYRWLNSSDNILYVGKAKDLRARMKSYVQKNPDKSLGPWKLALLKHIEDVDWTVTDNELEALILETNLIKEHHPKYNVLMKDDKNYVYVMITRDEFPHIEIVRNMQEIKKGAKEAVYFGPFTSLTRIKQALELLDEIFGYRACKRSVEQLNKDSNVKCKQCTESQIGKCNGLCMGKVSKNEYFERIEEVKRFFRGNHEHMIKKLKEMIETAAKNMKFERAARCRDTLEFIKSLSEQQIVSGTSGEDTDIFGVAIQADKAQIVLLQERNGRIINELSFSVKGTADSSFEVLSQFLPQYYRESPTIPNTIIVSKDFEETSLFEKWINKELSSDKKISIKIPERGKKSKLLKMAEENAKEKAAKELASWESAAHKIETALNELKDALKLKEKPKRIECYDISHMGGTETVGSMVVFVNGKSKNDQYRSFTIKTMKDGEIDDYKAIQEVFTRRLRHLAKGIKEEETAWAKNKISFSKAKKDEIENIKEFMEQEEEHLSPEDLNHEDFIVGKIGDKIISFGRLLKHSPNEIEIKSAWVHPSHRNKGLGTFMVRKLLQKANKMKFKKVYIRIFVEMEEFYSSMGFVRVKTLPPVIGKKVAEIRKNHPDINGTTMVYIFSENKEDSSLGTKPDLIVIDGGKGQLGVGVKALKAAKLKIPIISLAKREEEVFVPRVAKPIQFPKDSESLFILMRLRDEAHRFANRHREKKMKNSVLG
ncbi:excinuclease ABC subunit UvrC [Candidatus Peribacteria bacterium]|nr:excinuclease ABC subunit UvrC [Candidatus Peribacteria bacterium]MBT4021070.1 excinuclease ABC subunit UvrC [Candidatus Peribacteria bacterium]MBT4240791.1 excinuclease ABC subunit UvrC [Candidatus Peribacteria bacterium]MBT4474180.1 excinuclease ABC subunit UvrC [Candidatus Peribacteria bacterium]